MGPGKKGFGGGHWRPAAASLDSHFAALQLWCQNCQCWLGAQCRQRHGGDTLTGGLGLESIIFPGADKKCPRCFSVRINVHSHFFIAEPVYSLLPWFVKPHCNNEEGLCLRNWLAQCTNQEWLPLQTCLHKIEKHRENCQSLRCA